MRRPLLLIVVLTLSALPLLRAPLAIALEDSDRLWRVGTSAFDDKLYPTARRVLEEFVAKYPDDRRAGEAWLLLGKARFAQQDLAPALDAFRRALGLKVLPGRPGEAKFWEAETLFRLKRYAEAETAYDAALQVVLEKDPKLPFAADTMYGRGWAQLEQKRLDPAIKSFREVLEAWPDSPLAPAATFALARTLVDLKRYDEALPLLSAFGTKYPKSQQVAEAQYLLGWTRLTTGQTGEGIQALRVFVTAHPTHELADTARRQITEAVLKLGDRGEFETEYRVLITAPKATPDSLYVAGQIAARLGRAQDEEAAWKRLRQEFRDHPLAQRAAFELAKSAYSAERWEDTVALAKEAVKNDELKPDAYLLLGEALLKLKDYAAALDAFKTVMAMPALEGRLRYRALAGSAVAQEEQQRVAEALTLYEEVAQGSPDAALQQWAREAVLALGKARLAAGDLERALDAFRRAERLQPAPGRPQEAKYWEAETLFRLKRYAEARAAYEAVGQGDAGSPLAPDAVYGLAWLEVEQKRLEPAIRGFRQLLEKWPEHPLVGDATFALARTLVDAKRYDQAIPVLGTFLSRYPSHEHAGDAQYLLGWAEFGVGKTTDAIRDLRRFVASYPTHPLVAVARRKINEVVERLGDKGELEAQYRMLIDDPAPAAEDLYDAGVIAGQLGRPEDQEAAWKRLRQEFPDNALAQRTALELARFAYKREEYSEVISLAGAAAKTPELAAEALLVIGEAKLKLRDYAGALEAFKTVTATPGAERGLRYRALAGSAVAQEEQQRVAEALTLYEEVAQGSPDAALQQWAREAVLALGKARLAAGDLERALDAFRRAERLQPAPGRPQEAKYWEAETLFRLKRYADAQAAYEAVLRDAGSPLTPDAVYGLAWLELEQKQPEPAIRGFRQLLEKWPGHALAGDATFTLARTLVDLKRYDEAVPILQGFVTKYPTHDHLGDAQYLLGWTELATDKTADGIKHLRAFLAANPSSELAAPARRKLTEAVERLGDKGELATQYRTLTSEPTPAAEDLYDAGTIAGQLGRPDDQEAAWKRLRQEFPDHALAPRATLDLAHLAYTREQYRDAVTLASAETKMPELQAEASLVVGEAKLKLRDYDGALDAFKTVKAPGVDAGLRYRALAGSAVAAEEQHKLDDALSLYQEVAQRSPDQALQQWARDRVAAVKVQQGRLRELAALDQATALFKAKKYADAAAQGRALAQSEEADLRAGALLLVGDAELKLKRPTAALEAFDAAAAVPGLDPASRYRALAGSGVAHEEQQQWPEALALYQEVADKSADETLKQWARERVGVIRAQQERLARRVLELAEAAFKRKKYEEALGQAHSVADGSTGGVRADALLLVGQAQLKLNQYTAALEAFDAAAAVPGIQPLVQFRALAGSATAYEELRQWGDAIQKYEQIAASSPDLTQRKWARARAAAVKARQASPPRPAEKKRASES